MDLLQRYGIKEVADVTFYEIQDGKPGKPVLYLDTLKVSTTEQTAELTEARGGKGNSALMTWDYGKEITLNVEDALFSDKSLEVMYGGDRATRYEIISLSEDETDSDFVYNGDYFTLQVSGKALKERMKFDDSLSVYLITEGVEILLEDGVLVDEALLGKGAFSKYQSGNYSLPEDNYTVKIIDPFALNVRRTKVLHFSGDGKVFEGGSNDEWSIDWTLLKEGFKLDDGFFYENGEKVAYSALYVIVNDVAFQVENKGGSISGSTTTDQLRAAGLLDDENELIPLKGDYLVEFLLDKNPVRVLDISANSFPGTYYVIGDTYARNEATGEDEFFQLIIPKAKILTESNTITLEADGEPTVFNMSLKALKSKSQPLMSLVQYFPATTTTLAGAFVGDNPYTINTEIKARYAKVISITVTPVGGSAENYDVECIEVDTTGDYLKLKFDSGTTFVNKTNYAITIIYY